MRTRLALMIPAATVLLLAGCAVSTPYPPAASPTPAPSESSVTVLPSTTEAQDALLSTFPNDPRTPTVTFHDTLNPNQPELFEDERVPAGQTATLRVSCAMVDGAGSIAIEVATDGAEPFVYEAPCDGGC